MRGLVTKGYEQLKGFLGIGGKHPELRKGEVFLGNSIRHGAECGWKTRRVGIVAYKTNGEVYTEGRPMFAQIQELVEAGVTEVDGVPLIE